MSLSVEKNGSDLSQVEETSFDQNPEMQSPPVAGAENELPKGYYRSKLFLGTYFAVATAVMSGVGSFGFAAPLLAQINADIGPDKDIAWVGYTYTLCLACTLTLIGRLSDLFGRRYFFVGGNFLAIVGAVICSRATSVKMLIGGMTVLSIAASTQIAFQFVMGELVPIGKRFLVMASIFAWTLPLGGFGPIISTSLEKYTEEKWRWCFYLLVILNTLSTSLFLLFYFPPTFKDLEKTKSKLQMIKEFDIVGLVLFTGGFFIFLMGLTWGGNAYAWASAPVICTVVLGFLSLVAFVLWEMYADLKAPYIPFRLFKNLRWVAMVLCLSIGANQFYALALVWPKMVIALWPEQAAGQGYGWLACITGAGLIIGQISGGIIATYVNQKALMIIGATSGSALLAAAACATEYNFYTVLPLLIVGFLMIGMQEAVCGTFTTIALRDQKDIGAAGGVAGTIRSGFSALGSVIYGAVLTNRLAQTIPALVPVAATNAGLPASSIANLIKLLQGTAAASTVSGLTPDILFASTRAYRQANALAFRDVMLTTLAFGGLSMILVWFTPSIDKEKAKFVSRTLHKRGKGENNADITEKSVE